MLQAPLHQISAFSAGNGDMTRKGSLGNFNANFAATSKPKQPSVWDVFTLQDACKFKEVSSSNKCLGITI
jgi:hypothetical protein